ncbi:heparan-alpha-glucosaminide N-acetyltransferase domain-containing protein [Nocardioides sp. SYSU D00038]|uniref:heparan-alpha-glucosaminide N-acetyltransferase domain-containing protein n=1 Tax=Nocardioides sp. SYSU D00038 TaxID=2812554 RepID=UPI001968082D|nr:heparan-alpha-glucosaminide N-acetyltransferase domain-containing protein [Nocardioides sp. SYSU D00038]
MAAPAAPRTGRLVGLDVARCLALLGMVATHVLDARDPDGTISAAQWLAGGRASALFAVLAGVSIALVTGRREPVRGRAGWALRGGLVVRALLVAGLGLLLGIPDSGLAVILTYYGVLFLLALPFTGLRTGPLLWLAVGWVLVAPVVSHLLRPHLPERGVESPQPDQLGSPGRLLSELLLTGYYPALPWLAYVLLGLAIGRADLASRRVQALLAGVGLAVAVAATQVSHALTRQADVVAGLLRDRPDLDGGPALLDEISTGMYGNPPRDGSSDWLLVVAPHSSTPFDLAQTMGSAALVIGACLLVVGTLGRVATRATAIVFGAGTMTLTLYSLHVLLHTEDVWPPDDAAGFGRHVAVLVVIGAVFVAGGLRGPLERLVSAAAGAVSRRLAGARPS